MRRFNRHGIRLLTPATPRTIAQNVEMTQRIVEGIRPAPGSSGGLLPIPGETKRQPYYRNMIARRS